MFRARGLVGRGGLATVAVGALFAFPASAGADDGGAVVVQRACRPLSPMEMPELGVAHVVFTPSVNVTAVCHGEAIPGLGEQRIELTACRIGGTSTSGEGFAMVTPSGEVIAVCQINPSNDASDG
jgi:hypothetical protein